MAGGSEIESVPTPSIKTLKSKFEQLTQDSPPVKPPTPTPLLHSQSPLTPDVLVHRPRASLGCDERPTQQPLRALRSSTSSSDMRCATKRAPPPPPRSKKPAYSPISSPLLRPVPSPPTLKPSNASLERTARASDLLYADDTSVLENVASLRSRFSSTPEVGTANSPRARLAELTPRNDTGMNKHAGIAKLPSHEKPDCSQALFPITVDSPEEMSEFGVEAGFTPRMMDIPSLRDRITSLSIPVPQSLKIPSSQDHLACHSEPNILAPKLPVPYPRRPIASNHSFEHTSTLLRADDNLDLPSSSNSSLHSPFSDDESDLSGISEVVASPGIPLSRTSKTLGNTNGGQQGHNGSDVGAGPPILSKPQPPPRRNPPALSHPPSVLKATLLDSHPAVIPTNLMPPPLPSRRRTAEEDVSDVVRTSAPPLPARSHTVNSEIIGAQGLISPVNAQKALGSSKLPPPPTRQIGLGDKLPPVRRPHLTSSEEESGGDDDPKIRAAEALPDASCTSRRPPVIPSFNYFQFSVHVPAYSAHVAVAAPNVTVAIHPHVKYYDLSCSDGPVWVKEIDGKVSCLEFRVSKRGKFLWVGTREGQLLELDARTGNLLATKSNGHACQVTHIFRHKHMMLTIDESGKVMVFDPSVGASEDISLVFTQPRVYRIAEKQDFVKMLGGLLWTSARCDMTGTGPSALPLTRIYDPLVLGSTGRCVFPSQHVGAVTSGTALSSHPDRVYLGHEGGFITVWHTATRDGTPVCTEVIKVSSSDVLCLEGVDNRLWAGGRNGTISAYDITAKPWVVTNCWDAHKGLPVLKLFADPFSIERVEQLCIVSIGRDEQLRFWDGLLGEDWIHQELLKREASFSTFRNINVLIVSWNVDAAKPDALINDAENLNFFQNVFQSVRSPDIISFGFQEVIDLESRKMAAKTVLLGGKKKGEDGKISEKVTSSYKQWHDRLILAVEMAMPPDSPYTVVHTESLVGLFTCMFVKNAERISLKDSAINTIKRGMGGRYGNKGAIVARLVVDDSSICFVNCHLAASQNHVRQRNADITAILENKFLFPTSDATEEPLAYVGGGDGSMVLDHETVFVNGDMNYRIDQRRDAVITACQAGQLDSLHVHDQLLKEMKYNRAFRLCTFQEGPLTFLPTYKYDRRSAEYDTSEKRRVPAWCDRVLWRARDPSRVKQLNYQRYEANVSDHRPISAAFTVTVKSVRHDVRAREKAEVTEEWKVFQAARLAVAYRYYLKQEVV